jgi:ABC-2 type transport system permease protein
MRTVITIALNELRLIFRDQSIWINIIVIPIAITFAVGLANSGFAAGTPAQPTYRVDVIDNANSPLSAQFIAAMRQARPGLIVCPADATAATADQPDPCQLDGEPLTETLAEQRARDRVVSGTVIIPPDFDAQLAASSASIVYRTSVPETTESTVRRAVDAAVREVSGVQTAVNAAASVAAELSYLTFENEDDRQAFLASVREAAEAAWQTQPERVISRSAPDAPQTRTATGGFGQSVPGMGSMYVMFAVFPAATALLLERQFGTFQRTLTMPVRRWQFIAGKMGARIVLGMIQYAIIFAFGLLLGVRYGSDPFGILITMLVFVICVTALTLMVSTFVRDVNQASGLALFLSLTLAPLGGAWWPLEIVPEWMRVVGHISPIAWAMNAYNELIFFGGSALTILPYLAALGAFTALFFGIGVLRLRYE